MTVFVQFSKLSREGVKIRQDFRDWSRPDQSSNASDLLFSLQLCLENVTVVIQFDRVLAPHDELKQRMTVSTFYFMSMYALSSNGPTSLFLFGSTASGQRAFTAITRFSSSTRWNNPGGSASADPVASSQNRWDGSGGSCEEILSLEGPSLEDFCIPDWKPAQVNASVDGSTATVKFWVATPVHRVRRYNLYLGKPPDSDVPDFYAWFPRIFAMATVQEEQVNEKFASHTFRDLKPGDYTVQVAAQKVDAIRSKPTLFTISERPETPPAPRAATASAAPGGKREREKCAEEKRLLGKSGSGSQDEVSQLKKEIKKLNSKFARLKKKAQRPRKKKRRQRPVGSY
ncbi:uncharacterized protein LOC144944405 [Lampetra fluviatilis]